MPPTARSESTVESSIDEMTSRPSGLSSSVTGCGYLLFVLAVTTVMLIINAIVCLSIHSAVMSFGPRYMQDKSGLGPHFAQLFFFLAPVLLTIVQWNLLDRLNRIMRGK